MKFIFPKNYNYQMKLFGFINYSTAIFDIIIGILIGIFINWIFSSINIKIYVFIASYLPIVLFSISGINRENLIKVIIYLFKYIKNRKVYLYNKTKFEIIYKE